MTMAAAVYVNHGRWVVDCPHEECSWAYAAMSAAGEPLRFLRCRGGVGVQLDSGLSVGAPGCGTQFTLVWPPLAEALEVERLLSLRTSLAARNWRAPETPDTLHSENEAMLVGWDIRRLIGSGIGGELT